MLMEPRFDRQLSTILPLVNSTPSATMPVPLPPLGSDSRIRWKIRILLLLLVVLRCSAFGLIAIAGAEAFTSPCPTASTFLFWCEGCQKLHPFALILVEHLVCHLYLRWELNPVPLLKRQELDR